ncbi:hypothetical protein J4477_04670, partial [Candidatus Pacearchaeota archaeon]|nr:hypothetical protein [Candidatus Pacearchaeota archaeon]
YTKGYTSGDLSPFGDGYEGQFGTVYDFCIQLDENGTYPWINEPISNNNAWNRYEVAYCEKNCAIYEMSCKDNGIWTNVPTCPSGCSNGACVEEPNILWSWVDANPSLLELGNESVIISYQIDVTESTYDLLPENYSADIYYVDNYSNFILSKKVTLLKSPYHSTCYYSDGYKENICMAYYSSSYSNQEFNPANTGLYNAIIDDKSRYFYVVYDGYFDDNLVYLNDNAYGDDFYNVWYNSYQNSLDINIEYSLSNNNYEVGFYDFLNNVSADRYLDEILEEVTNQGFSISVSEIDGNKLYLLGIASRYNNDEYIYSFWKSGNVFIITGNLEFEINETNPKFDSQDFVNALVGDGNSYSLEAPTLESIDSNHLALIKAYLAKHPSSLTGNEINCIPKWECSLTPLICPEYGKQVESCRDINNCNPSYERQKICVPGICSGCLVKNLHLPTEVASTCIPYTIRQVVNDVPSYCDIDGQIKEQKVNVQGQEWPKCQNNYECESNACSSGECLPVSQAIKEAGRIKALFFELICRIANPISKEEREQCVANFLGE